MSDVPTTDELQQFSIRAFRGIEAGLGQADPTAEIARKLEVQHPNHLILVQAGKFLHGFDRLTRYSNSAQNCLAVETSAVGIGVPVIGGQPPLSGFLSSVAWQAQWAGRAGQRKLRRSYPGTPTRTVPPTRLASGKRNDKTLDRSNVMGLKYDHTGQRFGRLFVISKQGDKWLCRCDCGSSVSATGSNLRSGDTVSCGCRKKEGFAHATKHGKRNSRAYVIWQGMRQRCENPNKDGYAGYGGKGISVCERWHQFENFLADMGDPPAGTSIDRIDGSGNYEPGNCRWATSTEQARNRSTNRAFDIGNQKKTLVELCEMFGVNYFTVSGRLRSGKTIEQALGNPVCSHGTSSLAECGKCDAEIEALK